MNKIKIHKHGIAFLLLMLMVSNMTLVGWAKALLPTSAQPQQRKKLPPAKVVPVPDDWITIEDEEMGYSFEVPKGTKHTVEKKDDIVFIFATPPAPIAAQVVVVAFKNRRYTKENLLKIASGMMTKMGAKSMTPGELVEVSEEYSVTDYTGTSPVGVFRGKALVATGVNDSYVMLVSAEEAKFKANEEVIDILWAGFSILPAGAHISDLTLGKDKAMRQPAEEFTTTETIFAAVKISKNEGTVTVKGKLHVVEIAGQKPGPIPATEVTLTVKGDNTANFNFSKPTKGWPLGTYKFEAVMLNEKGEATDTQSHEFTVN